MLVSPMKTTNAKQAAKWACGNSSCKGCPFLGQRRDVRICEVCMAAFEKGFAKGVQWQKAMTKVKAESKL